MMLTAPPLIRNTNSDPPPITTPSAPTQARSTIGFESSDAAIVVARSRHSSDKQRAGLGADDQRHEKDAAEERRRDEQLEQ